MNNTSMNNTACFMNDFNRTYRFIRSEIPDFVHMCMHIPYGATFTTSAENMLLAFNEIRYYVSGRRSMLYIRARWVRFYKTTLRGVYVVECAGSHNDYARNYYVKLVDAQTIIDTYLDNLDLVAYNNCDIADVTGVSKPVFQRI